MFTEEQVKNETMLFSATPDFAEENGGPITKHVVSLLKEKGISPNTIIDSRVHMLMPGWIPAIGGWHLDGVPRDKDGQPIMDHPQLKIMNHWIYIVDFGTGATTEYVPSRGLTNTLPPEKGNSSTLWKRHSLLINDYIDDHYLKPLKVNSNELTNIQANTYHRGVKATGTGWRFFLRASENTLSTPRNEIRRQVQAYIESENEGW